MGKRSDFPRRARDHYATPLKPVLKLMPHLRDCRGFAEPCCGDGALIRALEGRGWRCLYAADIDPQGAMRAEAMTAPVSALDAPMLAGCTHIITNPPWPAPAARGEPTLGIIHHCMALLPTWLLLNADFVHNEYAREPLRHCRKIVSVGRVKWIEGSAFTGKDNAAWHLFDASFSGRPKFYGWTDPPVCFAPDVNALL